MARFMVTPLSAQFGMAWQVQGERWRRVVSSH